MSTSTKLMIVGLVVCAILGIVLQSVIASKMQNMSGDELLTPDQQMKLKQKEDIKNQMKFEESHKK